MEFPVLIDVNQNNAHGLNPPYLDVHIQHPLMSLTNSLSYLVLKLVDLLQNLLI